MQMLIALKLRINWKTSNFCIIFCCTTIWQILVTIWFSSIEFPSYVSQFKWRSQVSHDRYDVYQEQTADFIIIHEQEVVWSRSILPWYHTLNKKKRYQVPGM